MSALETAARPATGEGTSAAIGQPELVLCHDAVEDLSVYKPAGLVQRWYALTLDFTFFAPLDVLVHMPFDRLVERYAAYGDDLRQYGLTVLLTALPALVYFIAPTALQGQTLGKKIVGLRVVTKDCGATLPLSSVLIRETVGKLLSVATLGVGFLMAAYGDRRALHDRLSDTRVITYKE